MSTLPHIFPVKSYEHDVLRSTLRVLQPAGFRILHHARLSTLRTWDGVTHVDCGCSLQFLVSKRYKVHCVTSMTAETVPRAEGFLSTPFEKSNGTSVAVASCEPSTGTRTRTMCAGARLRRYGCIGGYGWAGMRGGAPHPPEPTLMYQPPDG